MKIILALLLSFVQAMAPRPSLLKPDAPEINRRAPDVFRVRFETSKGNFIIEVQRDWSPNGADHFYNLVQAGYYDQTRFYRVVKDRWTQFGINGDPQISNIWKTRTIPDDPRKMSNTRGMVAYAFAVTNGRTTQVFINPVDNSGTLDAQNFVPFGTVIEGMAVVDSLYSGYGENSGGGIRAGQQTALFERGNAYLDEEFPLLDKIIRAVVLRA